MTLTMIRKTVIFVLLTALLAPAAWGAAGPWAENEQSRVRLVTPWSVAPRDGDLRLGLHFTLAPGWHVYWKNSGDAGFPPVVVFQPAPGLGQPELLWPAPERFELPGDLVAFGYETEVVYPVRATLRGAPGDRLRLQANVDYLVCEVDCIPYRYDLTLDQPLGDAGVADAATQALVDRWWRSLPTAPSGGLATSAELQAGSGALGPVLEVRVQGARPAAGSGIFLESHELFETGKPAVQDAGDGTVVYRVPLQPREANKPLPESTEFAWTVTDLLGEDGQPLHLEARGTVRRVAASPPPAGGGTGPRISLLRQPATVAGLAAAFVLLALYLWGQLGSPQSSSLAREVLGFLAAAAAIGLLYDLSRRVRAEGLAFVELALLVMALCAWLLSRNRNRRVFHTLLLGALAAAAFAAPWLADRHRLDLPSLPGTTETVQAAPSDPEA